MGRCDDYFACIGDWMYSQAPGETFASMLNDDVVTQTDVVNDSENISGHLFQSSQGQGALEYPDGMNPSPLNTVADENISGHLFQDPLGQGAFGYPDGMNPSSLNIVADGNISGHLFQGPQGQGAFEYPDVMNSSSLNTVADENTDVMNSSSLNTVAYENTSGHLFQGPQGQGAFEYSNGMNPSYLNTGADENTSGHLFQGPRGQGAFGYPDGMDPSSLNTWADENTSEHLFQGPQGGQGAFGYPDGMNPSSLNTVTDENTNGHLFQYPQGQGAFGYTNGTNPSSLNTVAHENMNANALAESANQNHGGLKERAVARSDFNANALRVNTESINPQDYSQNQGMMSSCWTTLPDLVSPPVFLDSPELITNPLAMPSPTVGKYAFSPGGNNQNSTLPMDNSDNGKENIFPDFNASPFGFNDANPSSYFGAANGVNSNSGFGPESFTGLNVADIPFPPQCIDNSNVYAQVKASLQQADGSKPQDMDGGKYLSSQQTRNAVGVTELSPPINRREEDTVDRSRKYPDSIDDGYTWRKYGQKQVKGSEFPKSYFKCTHVDCPARKKIQHAAEGFGETTRKGSHNHPKPPPIRNPGLGEMPLENCEHSDKVSNGDIAWSSIKLDNADPMSSIPQGKEYENGSSIFLSKSGSKYGYMGRFVNNKDDDPVTNRDVRVEIPAPKKRRTEMYTPDMGASRTMKEPRVVVQTKSEVDVIDDGYCWRKYGQKLVRGNPNPRSYYKCTDNNCNVRKHVERASTDLTSVITTYEGKHNHNTPAARRINRFIPGHSYSGVQQAPSNLNLSGPSQLGSFGLPAGSGLGFKNGMNRRGIAPGLGIAGLPVNPYPGQSSSSFR